MTLEIGDIIEDNDPRMIGRKLKVVAFEERKGRVVAVCERLIGKRKAVIRVSQIFTDDKPRRYGFRKQAH